MQKKLLLPYDKKEISIHNIQLQNENMLIYLRMKEELEFTRMIEGYLSLHCFSRQHCLLQAMHCSSFSTFGCPDKEMCWLTGLTADK